MPSHISPNFASLPPYAILWRTQWHPTPVLLPGKSYGWRSLVGCSPWGSEELDMNEWLHFHFSLLCIGEGNGNPLQCSCLENPRDGGAWKAAVYGVVQSWTQLKRLSSSSSSSRLGFGEEHNRDKVPFLWPRIKGVCCHITNHWWCFPSLPGWSSTDSPWFPTVKFYFFFPFSTPL